MKNLGKTLICGIAALLAITAMADAPETAKQFTPKLMNYQGYLADPSTGKPYADGIYHLQCRLYRVAVEGTAIWGGEYAVYVNGGYFNIMLGDPSAQELEDENCTYSNTNLWRAIWSDASVADENERNNLWLGVTPLENSKNNAIASPTEIKPRQQLLTAPYAFRAQSAEYANESPGDFTVNGKLKVSEIAVPSGQSLTINNFSVSSEATTIQSSANTSISAGGNLNMSASGNTALSASGTARISADGDVYVSPATSGVLYCQGASLWKSTASGEYKKPFIVRRVGVTVASGNKMAIVDVIEDPEYRYFFAGIRSAIGVDFCDVYPNPLDFATHSSRHRWMIQVQLAETTSQDIDVYVTIFGVLNELVEDPRLL